MSSQETMPRNGSGGVATPTSEGLLDSPACCLQCRRHIAQLRPGQKACSARCRWALWKASRDAAARVRDRKIGELLLTAEESLKAAKRLLEEDEERNRRGAVRRN